MNKTLVILAVCILFGISGCNSNEKKVTGEKKDSVPVKENKSVTKRIRLMMLIRMTKFRETGMELTAVQSKPVNWFVSHYKTNLNQILIRILLTALAGNSFSLNMT
ncbi:MAG: hypothetical protein IPL53_20320 [Ignavibacteria bacterium]|nr:hypothetical protein [Ignavibacteria bacterium]